MMWFKSELIVVLYLAAISYTLSEEVVTQKEGALQRFERELKTTVYKVFGELDLAFKRLLDGSLFNNERANDLDEISLFSRDSLLKRDCKTSDIHTELTGTEDTTCNQYLTSITFRTKENARLKRKTSKSKRTLDSGDSETADRHLYIVSVHNKRDKSYIQTGAALTHTVVATPSSALYDLQGNPYKADDLIITTHTNDGKVAKEHPVTQVILNPSSSTGTLDKAFSSHSPLAFLGTQGLEHIIASDFVSRSRKLAISPKGCSVVGWRQADDCDGNNCTVDTTSSSSLNSGSDLKLKTTHLVLSKASRCVAYLPTFNVTRELCSVRKKTRNEEWYDIGDALLICSGKLEGFVTPKSKLDLKTAVTLFSRLVDYGETDPLIESFNKLPGHDDFVFGAARTRWGPHITTPTPLLILTLALLIFL